jgi:preprotein translocase subunit YajC
MNKKGFLIYVIIIIFIVLLVFLGISFYLIVEKQKKIRNYLDFMEEDKSGILSSLGDDYARIYLIVIALLFVVFLMIKFRKKTMRKLGKKKNSLSSKNNK